MSEKHRSASRSKPLSKLDLELWSAVTADVRPSAPAPFNQPRRKPPRQYRSPSGFDPRGASRCAAGGARLRASNFGH